MKVILCHNRYQITGGAEFFVHETTRILKAQGHEVVYFSAHDSSSVYYEGGRYFPKAVDYSPSSTISSALMLPQMIYNRNAKKNFACLIDDFKPDIVHAFSIYIRLTPAILDAAREAGVPVVMSCNDYKHICPNYKLYHHGDICEECKGGKFYRAMVNRCCHESVAFSVASTIEAYAHEWMNIYLKNVHTFLFASEFMAHKTEEFWGAGSFRWRMLRNPFDARKHLAAQTIGDYALFFGRLIDEKGVNILLDAAAIQPGVPVVVVGEGPDTEKLEAQARSLGLNHVKFVGAKWGADMDQILFNCRFVVVPSLWHENFPYVILQSFAKGKPVIGTNRGGIPELIEHGQRGLIYEATNPNALAAAMGELMQDETKVNRMGSRAKQYADAEFNDERFYERLMQIYDEVLV